MWVIMEIQSAIIGAVIGGLFSLLSVIFSGYWRKKDIKRFEKERKEDIEIMENKMRKETFKEKLVMRLRLIDKKEKFRTDKGEVVAPVLRAEYVQGFPKSNQIIFADVSGNRVISPELEIDRKKLEKTNAYELAMDLNFTLVFNAHNSRYNFSYSIHLFQGFEGEKYLYLVLYMFEKDTGNYKEGFVFDEFYLSMIGNKDNNVALPTNNLNGEDQIVVKDLLNQILPLYKEIEEKI